MSVKKKMILLLLLAVFLAMSATVILPNADYYALAQENVSANNIDQLLSLPYISQVENDADINKKGVTAHDAQFSYDGINIYASDSLSEAFAIDMGGNILHKWALKAKDSQTWDFSRPGNNGDMYVIDQPSSKNPRLLKLTWKSHVAWMLQGYFHHDIVLAPGGGIYALALKPTKIGYNAQVMGATTDYIVKISEGGKIEQEISLAQVLRNNTQFRELLRRIILENEIVLKKDIFHANSLQVLDRDIEVAKKGDLLTCCRNLDTIVIIRPKTREVVWSWGYGELDRPHQPSVLTNGNILIFDNGWHRGYSRLVEVCPKTKKIVWEYKANPPEEFFSMQRGGCEKLPNNNVLITESEKGRVFEITSDGKIVWEWYNPHFFSNNKRAVLYRMTRVRKDAFNNLKFNEGEIDF